MRSGNGRHRRPRQAPALFVTAGVTGAGLAMPLLAAGGAQAADAATWDRVAQCESGGMWSANAGNGYYGGLQLTLETWQAYGGTELAERPDLASRSQQIEIAEKILADRGPDAWPHCSISAGLLPEAPDVEVPEVPETDLPDAPELPDAESPDTEAPDTGTPDPSQTSETPDPSETSDVPDSSQTPEAPDGSADGSTEGSTGPADGSTGGARDGSTAPAPDATSGTGSGIGDPGEGDTPQSPDASDGRTGGEGTGRHRGGPADGQRDDADRPSRGRHGKSGESGAEDSYRVRPGDSLSAIAAEHEVPGGWTGLYESNRKTVGDDPDLILPGQLLDLRTGGELR